MWFLNLSVLPWPKDCEVEKTMSDPAVLLSWVCILQRLEDNLCHHTGQLHPYLIFPVWLIQAGGCTSAG